MLQTGGLISLGQQAESKVVGDEIRARVARSALDTHPEVKRRRDEPIRVVQMKE